MESLSFQGVVVVTTAVLLQYSEKVYRKNPKYSVVGSWYVQNINWSETKVDIIASSAIYTMYNTLKKLEKHMTFTSKVPNCEGFYAP